MIRRLWPPVYFCLFLFQVRELTWAGQRYRMLAGRAHFGPSWIWPLAPVSQAGAFSCRRHMPADTLASGGFWFCRTAPPRAGPGRFPTTATRGRHTFKPLTALGHHHRRTVGDRVHHRLAEPQRRLAQPGAALGLSICHRSSRQHRISPGRAASFERSKTRSHVSGAGHGKRNPRGRRTVISRLRLASRGRSGPPCGFGQALRSARSALNDVRICYCAKPRADVYAKNPDKRGCCSIASATGCQGRRTK